MKVYIDPPQVPSQALDRVMAALTRYAPSQIEFVTNSAIADLVVLNVIGRHDRIYAWLERLVEKRQPYAVIQYCLRSTLRTNTREWLHLWDTAKVVWSYYDLPQLCRDDGYEAWAGFEFYHAPLGADADVFKPSGVEKPYIICTSGRSFLTESVREAVCAARMVGRRVAHLGLELNVGVDVDCFRGLSDTDLARLYSQCEFVAGLRRVEGFELPAAEGLLCGARPILFDRPHYRQWYDGWGVFIQEQAREQVIDSLEAIFRQGARQVTLEEREEAMKRFEWQTIVKGFWERCL